MSILHSSISLIKQQSKVLNKWDHCIKIFFAKKKQRQMQTYVYSIVDDRGNKVEGFEKLARVMTEFYQGLLGKQRIIREHMDWESCRRYHAASRATVATDNTFFRVGHQRGCVFNPFSKVTRTR